MRWVPGCGPGGKLVQQLTAVSASRGAQDAHIIALQGLTTFFVSTMKVQKTGVAGLDSEASVKFAGWCGDGAFGRMQKECKWRHINRAEATTRFSRCQAAQVLRNLHLQGRLPELRRFGSRRGLVQSRTRRASCLCCEHFMSLALSVP